MRPRWSLARCQPWRAAALLVLVLSGCALFRGRDPEDRQITVELPVPRTEAVRRTHAVFRAQGYRIRETLTSGTEPETERFRHADADVVFRAAIDGEGRRSRVVFTGTYRERDLGGLVHGSEKEVRRDSDEKLDRELWARLQNLAITLKRER